jgi:hypothetical protein
MATRYWVGGTGTWTGTANWSATSGGASGASAPTNADTVIFDANSSSGSYTVTTSTSPSCQNLIMSGPASGILTFAGTNNLQYTSASGVHTLQILTPSTINWTNTGSPQFVGTGTVVFDTNGCQISGNIIIAGSMSSVTLNSDFSTTGSINFQSNSLVLNNYVMTVNGITFSAATSPNIAFGTGKIVTTNDYTGNAGLTVTGTPLVELASSGSTSILVSPVTTTLSPAISFKTTGAGTYALSIAAGTGVLNLDLSGHAGTLSGTTNSFTVYGNLTLSSDPNFSIVAGTGAITFGATSSKTITTNNKLIDRPVTFNGVGGTWVLQDAMTVGTVGGTARLLTHTNGTINLNGKTLTVASYVTAAGTKNITFNGGIITLLLATASGGLAVFNNAFPTNFTTSAGAGGNGFIYFTNSGVKTFLGNSSTYSATLVQASTGNLVLSGSNTIASIKNTTQPSNIVFTSSTTTTFTSDFKLKGTAGALITIVASTSGTAATVSKSGASGNVTCDYISVKDNLPAGGATWYVGAHSTRVSNYTGVNGWLTIPPSANTEFLTMFN